MMVHKPVKGVFNGNNIERLVFETKKGKIHLGIGGIGKGALNNVFFPALITSGDNNGRHKDNKSKSANAFKLQHIPTPHSLLKNPIFLL